MHNKEVHLKALGQIIQLSNTETTYSYFTHHNSLSVLPHNLSHSLLHAHKYSHSFPSIILSLSMSVFRSIPSFSSLARPPRGCDTFIRLVSLLNQWLRCNLNGGAEAKVSLFANTITTIYPAVLRGTICPLNLLKHTLNLQ